MPRFVKVPGKELHGRQHRRELQLWVVSNGGGFQVLRFSAGFKAVHKDLFEASDE
jgi:hypothetical protein